MTGVLLLSSLFFQSCAVPIHEQDWFSPLPGKNEGVVVTHFLSKKQEIIPQNEWYEYAYYMENQGFSLSCTFSPVIAGIKRELEEACSKTHCVYDAPADAPALTYPAGGPGKAKN